MQHNFFRLMTFVFILTMTLTALGAKKYQVYFGTASMQGRAGVFSSILDIKTGKLSKAELVGKAIRTGIIAINSTGTYLYTSGRPVGFKGARRGSVCAFEIDQSSGKLKFLNTRETQGIGPCYLMVGPKQRNLLVAHYRSGNCSVLPIAVDGSLKAVSSVKQHTGSSIHPARQTAPHQHSIILDPAGRYVFVTDLGIDKIMIYKFKSSTGKLTPNKPSFVAVKAGGGPRHFVFSPAGKFAYTNLELSSEITAFKYDAGRGILKTFQTISTLPKDFSGRNFNAGICITPDGRFLYVSNRGHNSIAIFSIASETGKLTALGSESTRGDVPQTIKIDPSGNYIIETDKRGGKVRVFRINKKTGSLTQTDSIKVPRVGSIAFREKQ